MWVPNVCLAVQGLPLRKNDLHRPPSLRKVLLGYFFLRTESQCLNVHQIFGRLTCFFEEEDRVLGFLGLLMFRLSPKRSVPKQMGRHLVMSAYYPAQKIQWQVLHRFLWWPPRQKQHRWRQMARWEV